MRTLYRNGRIYTSAAREATALLVENDLITWIGDEDGVAQHAGVRVVDLDDALVTPAFVDAHVHLTATGATLDGVDLSGAPTLAAALASVEAASRSGRGRPILASGWDDTTWPERRAPSAAELDRASYGGAVYLARVDAHSAVVSSALAASVPGLTRMTGYESSGLVTGPAHDAVRSIALAARGAADITRLQQLALRRAAELGIACVHEMAGPVISSADDLQSALVLGSRPQQPEVLGYWGELGGAAAARELGAVGAGGDLFCDGSLGSHTAALREPYSDRPGSSGALQRSTAELAEHVLACIDAGVQAGFHVIGDAALEQVLDALELATARLGRPAGAGQRLEHVEFVPSAARLAASGVLASMQPVFDATWGGSTGMYAARLGRERSAQLNRFAELAAAGVPLAFGSDAPVTALGPWAAVRAAAYPSDAAAAISPRAAFAAHTRAGWRAARRDGEGLLAPGAPATLAIWQAGELAVDAPDDRVTRWSTDARAAVAGLPDISPGRTLPRCLATVRRGVTIYDADRTDRTD